MKMQNAEMEFVTFDAQDVIATSGPLSTTFWVFGGNLVEDLYKSPSSDVSAPFDNRNSYKLDWKGRITNDMYYEFNKTYSISGSSLATVNLSMTGNKSSEAPAPSHIGWTAVWSEDSATSILNWLAQNCTLQ